MPYTSLDQFDIHTSRWFEKHLGAPTPVQEEAWPAIASGMDTLVSAPTGTGKTLSAFLVFIDRLKKEARNNTLKNELQLIYISPLKSLAGDIKENLRRPLQGIYEEERNMAAADSQCPFAIQIGIRTGDTPQKERRQMIKSPPHILITTPESLYLMLTSKSGQAILRTAKAIILDELHAMIDSKRGAHLMLSIARLDRLCDKPLQRIGLSATIEPLSIAAAYLSPDPVTIIAPKMHKKIQLEITSPYHGQTAPRKPLWQEIATTVYEMSLKSRSTIAFVEGRAYAEKLAYFVNQIGGDDFARTHHGSLSKEQRFEVEDDLRNGELRLLCATSSMELGIDVGEIDQVFQIGCPRTISSTLQRLGRAGHNPNRTSVMHIFPRTSSEGLYSALTAQVVRDGGIEYSKPPRLCLDVLAQHLVSMASGEGYEVDDVMGILPRAYPFQFVTKEDVKEVLQMLAGDYEHDNTLPVRPRVLYDRINERVEGDPYSRMLAISAAGTIPDRGLYAIKTEQGVRLGELDEEYVFEARIGDKFLLGTFSWQIKNIQKDTVIVSQATTSGARVPFWKGDMQGRKMQTGLAFGTLFETLGKAYENDTMEDELQALGLDETALRSAKEFLVRQIKITGSLPGGNNIIVEHFRDDTGTNQMMVHSVFGRQINSPLSILLSDLAKRQTNTNINYVEDDDGILLFPYGECSIPEGLLYRISPKTVRTTLEALILTTPLFNIVFRYNAGRALMMGTRKAGRQPLWIQRMRSASMLDTILQYQNHPLIRETKRECLEDYWDVEGLITIIEQIQNGAIEVKEMYLEYPSPMSLPLRQQTEASMMYDYAPTPSSAYQAAETALDQSQMIVPLQEHIQQVGKRKHLPEDEGQLHSLLMMEGDFIAEELDVEIEWLESLVKKGRANYIEPGLWIAAEQEDKYKAAFIDQDKSTMSFIILRLLRYRGEQTAEQIGERYLWATDLVSELLNSLLEKEKVVEYQGLYYHSELYNQARRETIKSRRGESNTLPPERYAKLLALRTSTIAPASEQLEKAINQLLNLPFPIGLWESVLLPLRVRNYRPEMLETLLSHGQYYWQMSSGTELSFHRYEDMDWDIDCSEIIQDLEGNNKLICDHLLKRGASFMQSFSPLFGGLSPYDNLLTLASRGVIFADSFLPVRQWINQRSLQEGTVKQRVSARATARTTGRWELARPSKIKSVEEELERIFDQVLILSRETIYLIPWVTALQTLRIWEYTGRVRRGYFIHGLSGIQFIRESDYHATIYELENPAPAIHWLNAIDPAQPWGKSLAHLPDRSFISVVGTIVGLSNGLPVAVMERQGKVLRVFDDLILTDVMKEFVNAYDKGRILTTNKRIILKEYPKEAVEALKEAGFQKEIQDYVLYRSIK